MLHHYDEGVSCLQMEMTLSSPRSLAPYTHGRWVLLFETSLAEASQNSSPKKPAEPHSPYLVNAES